MNNVNNEMNKQLYVCIIFFCKTTALFLRIIRILKNTQKLHHTLQYCEYCLKKVFNCNNAEISYDLKYDYI